MRKILLNSEKNFFKANLHCHSTYSDGCLTPEELKAAYKEQGYSVLAITDHDGLFDHGYLDDEDFITIPGYEREVETPMTEDTDWNDVVTCHMCFYPIDRNNIGQTCFDPDFYHPKFRWMSDSELKSKINPIGEYYTPSYSSESLNHIISEANKHGFLVTLNHPVWSQESFEQICSYEGLFAMEIYNTDAEKLGNLEYNSALYDLLLRKGKRLKCVAADDNHNYHGTLPPYGDSFGGRVMINAESLTHEAIITALKNGDFYSTTGPQIDNLFVEDEWVHIECSSAKKIRFITNNRYSKLFVASDQSLRSADFKLEENTHWFRVEITDFSGEKAYTNAYFKDDIIG